MSERPNFWWWLFPFTGIKITDECDDFADPIFGDATILSKACVASLLEKDSWLLGKALPTMASATLLRDGADSVIAVRKVLSSDDGIADTNQARLRFYEIASVLGLCSLTKQKYMYMWAPTDKMKTRQFCYIAICDDLEKAKGRENTEQAVWFGTGAKYCREELIKLLNESKLNSLVQILLLPEPKKKLAHPRLREILSAASIRLVDGLYTNHPGEIVTAFVNVLELLLGASHDNAVKSNVVQQRLDAFLQMDRLIDRKSENEKPANAVPHIFESRNDWIHKGREPQKEQIDDVKIFGIEALKYFADLALKAPNSLSHEDVLQWFDLHYFVRTKDAKALKLLNETVSDPFEWKTEEATERRE